MIAVLFEVEPKEEGKLTYFELASQLKGQLEQIPGFISVERFQSLSNNNRFLSLSFWQDEAAIKRWREHKEHLLAQQMGKEQLFLQYRIRVANVVRDYAL